MGRPRTPTALKKLRGTLQPCRTNRAEPKPKTGAPTPPAQLSDAAAAFWPEVTRVLTDMRVLATSDGLAVCALCEVLGDLAAARDALAKPVKAGRRIVAKPGARTYTTISRTGAVMIRTRPELALIADADRRLLAWLSRFGLSPADRSRVSEILGTAVNPFSRNGVDPFEEFLADKPTIDDYLATDPDLRPSSPRTGRGRTAARGRVQ